MCVCVFVSELCGWLDIVRLWNSILPIACEMGAFNDAWNGIPIGNSASTFLMGFFQENAHFCTNSGIFFILSIFCLHFWYFTTFSSIFCTDFLHFEDEKQPINGNCKWKYSHELVEFEKCRIASIFRYTKENNKTVLHVSIVVYRRIHLQCVHTNTSTTLKCQWFFFTLTLLQFDFKGNSAWIWLGIFFTRMSNLQRKMMRSHLPPCIPAPLR